MPGVLPTLRHGPATYQVNSAVTGGQLVIPDTTLTPAGVKTATALAVNVIGVAATDAAVRTSQAGQNPANLAQVADYVAVYYNVEIPVTYVSSANFGQKLAAAATGQVQPWTVQGATYSQAAGNADQIVGICTEPGGVGAGAVGRAWIGR